LAINVYEGMFIFDSGRYGRDPEGVSGAISKMIEEAGGEMLVSRLWEERRLAYPIKGKRREHTGSRTSGWKARSCRKLRDRAN
jgi:small subunit ribosomal protein S6